MDSTRLREIEHVARGARRFVRAEKDRERERPESELRPPLSCHGLLEQLDRGSHLGEGCQELEGLVRLVSLIRVGQKASLGSGTPNAKNALGVFRGRRGTHLDLDHRDSTADDGARRGARLIRIAGGDGHVGFEARSRAAEERPQRDAVMARDRIQKRHLERAPRRRLTANVLSQPIGQRSDRSRVAPLHPSARRFDGRARSLRRLAAHGEERGRLSQSHRAVREHDLHDEIACHVLRPSSDRERLGELEIDRMRGHAGYQGRQHVSQGSRRTRGMRASIS
jgi:hypothetical protein